MRPLLACGLLGVLAGLAAVDGLHAAKTPTVALVTLQPSDLRGFQEVQNRLIGNAAAARTDHVSVATFVRHGRIISSKRAFTRSGRPGIARVEIVVAAFKAGSGAWWDYRRVASTTPRLKSRSPYRKLHRLSLGTIGQERTAFSYESYAHAPGLLVDIVHFQRGRYRVSLEVVGRLRIVRAGSETALLRKLAFIVDRRVARVR